MQTDETQQLKRVIRQPKWEIELDEKGHSVLTVNQWHKPTRNFELHKLKA